MSDKLNIHEEGDGLITIASSSGIGKTTVMCCSVVEAYLDGKNILYLTDSDNENNILKRFQNPPSFLDTDSKNKIHIKRSDDLKTTLNFLLTEKSFDIIYFDSFNMNNSIAEFLREVSINHSVLIITSVQTRREFDSVNIASIIPTKMVQLSNKVYALSIKKDFKILEKLKYFFCFWLKKPNRRLKIIKNRYGDETSRDLFLDFEKCKIN